MKKYLIIILLSSLILIFSYVYQSQTVSDKRLHIVFCDVGQGDGIYIRTPDKADIVIDGGPANGKMLACLSKYMPFWDHKLELVFATHPDADHIGGLIGVLENYKVDSFSSSTDKNLNNTQMFERLKEEVRQQKIPFTVLVAGDKFKLSDGVVISTLWPTREFTTEETNEYSLVQVIDFKDFEALLTGDVSYQILNNLILKDSYEVFKAPHHGSKTGLDETSLERIKAYLVLISNGLNNRYHHPHPSVLSLLKRFNLPYLRTDKVGSIEIITDGKNTRVVNSKSTAISN